MEVFGVVVRDYTEKTEQFNSIKEHDLKGGKGITNMGKGNLKGENRELL